MLACSGRGPPSRGGQGAGPFCPRPLWARLGCPSAVLLRGGRRCHSAGPLPTSAASSQDSFCSPARFLLLFDSARPVLLALAVVPLQASPGGERLLPSGRRAGRLQGRTSPLGVPPYLGPFRHRPERLFSSLAVAVLSFPVSAFCFSCPGCLWLFHMVNVLKERLP